MLTAKNGQFIPSPIALVPSIRLVSLLALLVLAQPTRAAEVVIAVPSADANGAAGATAQAVRRIVALKQSGTSLTIRVEPYVDPCDPSKSVALARAIAASDAAVVIGHACAVSANVAAPIYAAAGKPLIVAGAMTGRAPPLPSPVYLPSTESQGSFIGARTAELAAVIANAKVAVLSDRTKWALGNAREAAAALVAAGGPQAMIETFAGGDKDFAPLSARLAAAGVTHVMLAAFGSEAGLLVADIVRAMPGVVIVGTETLAGAEFARAAGPAAASVLIAMRPDVETIAAHGTTARALLDGLAIDQRPASRILLATAAAVEVVVERARALADAGQPITAKSLAETLRAPASAALPPVETVLGPVSFDTLGQATLSPWRLYHWQRGKLTTVASPCPLAAPCRNEHLPQ